MNLSNNKKPALAPPAPAPVSPTPSMFGITITMIVSKGLPASAVVHASQAPPSPNPGRPIAANASTSAAPHRSIHKSTF